MDSLREDYVDSLCQEAVREMADNFFCPRRDLDQEIELFGIRAGAVREKGKTALLRAARLHAILLEGEAAPAFYAAIGADPGRLAELADVSLAFIREVPRPKDLSRREYARLVNAAYAALRDILDEYQNGRLYPDPEQYGRKVQSMHFKRLVEWCAEINSRIDDVNRRQGSSCVLCYFKNLDPARVERERVAGGGVDNFAQASADSLRLPPCDFAAFQLPDLPELPPPDSVEKAATRFAKELFDANEARIHAITGRLGGLDSDL